MNRSRSPYTRAQGVQQRPQQAPPTPARRKAADKRTFWDKIREPRRKKRALIIFWTIVGAPFAIVSLLLILISLGAFGTLPTFEELENPRSNIATEIITIDGHNLGNYYVENRSFVDYSELSPYLVQSLVATEDSRFYAHSGIDFIGLSRVAFKTFLMAQRDQGGGSTISQQLAKNLYPRDTVNSSGVVKAGKLVISKLKEWITASMLEYNYTKEEIVSMYLNTVEYGSNAYGVKSASRTFFNKEPRDLELEEAAMLVGVVNAPSRYSPVRNPERAVKRRNVVIGRLASAGFISDEQAQMSSAKPLATDYHPISHNDGLGTYFREMLRLYITATEPQREDYQSEYDFKQAQKLWNKDALYGWCNKNKKADGTPYNVYKDGLKIYTTIHSKMQQYAEEAVAEHMGGEIQPTFDRQRKAYGNKIFFGTTQKQNDELIRRGIMQSERARVMKRDGASESEIIAAFSVPQQMSIFTYKGDRDTTMTPRDSMLYSKAILRTGFVSMNPATGYVQAYVGGPNFRHFKYDMASQGKRQVGSTIKPFVYTFAIDHLGYNPCTLVPNLPVSIELGNGQVWEPKEAGRVEYDGEPRQLRWGLANSRNNYSAWIMKQTSPPAVAEFIHKMGVTSYIDPVYSMCLGTPEVSVMEMVAAFATFANRGVHTDPFFVTRIEDRQGNVLASFSPSTQDAISEKTAYTMLEMLQNNIAAGTGNRLRNTYKVTGQVGGKTGTTNNNADAWFIAVSPKMVGGAWVGGEERPTHLVNRGEGSVAALPIFGRYINKVYADKSLGITLDDKFMEPVGAIGYKCEGGDAAYVEEDSSTVRIDEFFE